MPEKKKYEEYSDIIEGELNKRKNSWQLNSVKYLDFDDIKQEIKLHIWKKFPKYDQKQPFLNWVNRVITRQLINKVRDNYNIFARPCLQCPFNQSKASVKGQAGNLCAFTESGLQCSECPLYKEWEEKKKPAYEIQFAQNIEFHEGDLHYEDHDVDYKEFLRRAEPKVKSMVSNITYKIYHYMYIKGLSKEETAKQMGYKSKVKPKANSKRTPGYKQILLHDQIIKEAIKEILKEEDYRFI